MKLVCYRNTLRPVHDEPYQETLQSAAAGGIAACMRTRNPAPWAHGDAPGLAVDVAMVRLLAGETIMLGRWQIWVEGED